MSTFPQLTWPGLSGPPQGPLPNAPAIPPDETAAPPDQLPLEPARPKAPEPVFAATTTDQTPYPSHARYGSTAVVVATATAALGPGTPAQRWWAGMDEDAIYLSGIGKPGLPPPSSPPFIMGPPPDWSQPEPPVIPPVIPPIEPPPIEPPIEPPAATAALTWFGQDLTWFGQPMTWGT